MLRRLRFTRVLWAILTELKKCLSLTGVFYGYILLGVRGPCVAGPQRRWIGGFDAHKDTAVRSDCDSCGDVCRRHGRKSADAAGQASTGGTPSFTPQSKPVAAGENEAKKMLVLMDTDKSGTVSRKEFMDYMAAEFDRLDVNHDGVLDVKELELMRSHQGGGHR